MNIKLDYLIELEVVEVVDGAIVAVLRRLLRRMNVDMAAG